MNHGFGEESEPKTIEDYFADLIEDLDENLPAGNVNENNGFYLHSQYVGRDNKRRVVLFVTHGKPTVARRVTRVTYILPVPEGRGAEIFNLVGRQPATPATFSDIDVPAGQDANSAIVAYAAAHNLATWHSEAARLRALEDTTPPGRLRTKIRNIGIYWRGMQRLMYDAIANTDIRLTRSFSNNPLSSSHRRTTSHHTSNVRALRSSSRRASAPRRTTSSRRQSKKVTSDPSKKPNSDPT